MSVLAYLWTNLYLGAGIAADVYAATIGSCREFEGKELRKWIYLNTLTHTLFPLAGMYAVILGIAAWGRLEGVLFALGAALLGIFLVGLVQRKAVGPPEDTGEQTARVKANLWQRLLAALGRIDPMWPLVLGVSVDAINSGFAKAADTRDWDLVPLLLSFPLVGLVVGLAAALAAVHGRWLLAGVSLREGEQGTEKVRQRFVRLELRAFLIELGVLGYFFWRSVGSAIAAFSGWSAAGMRWPAVVAALLSVSAVMLFLWDDIDDGLKIEADQVLGAETSTHAEREA